jgi:hypothetical protein
MSADIPTIEPLYFIAGDTVKWTITLSDYLATDGWILKYSLMKLASSSAVISISSSADGSDHAIAISATTSGAYTAGKYKWQSYVENALATEHYFIKEGYLEIKATFKTGTAFDARSDVQKIYEAIEAAILGKASYDQLSRKIGDRELRYISPEELIKLRNFYKQEYNKEMGKSGRKTLKVTWGD